MTNEPPATEVALVGQRHPNIRVTLWWLGAVAVFLAIILEVAAIVAGIMLAATLHGVADRFDQIGPAPTVTGCPFGAEDCGG